eukprot:gene17599-19352_t
MPGLDDLLERMERKDMSFVWKRRLTVITFCIRMFLVGVEYAIILPSVWLYLRSFKVETWFLGFVVSCYAFAAMISLPIVGRIFDKTRRTKELLFLTNTFEIIGSLLYALPFSPWLIVVGRLIAGLGDGFFAAASGEITHVYPAAKRTGIFALMEIGRVLGITLGPALNFFLQNIDFNLGKWHINYGPAPGLFMAVVWLMMQVVTVFMVFDLSKDNIEEEEAYEEINLETKKPPEDVDNNGIMETKIGDSDDQVEKKRDSVDDDDKKPLLSSPSKPKEEIKENKATLKDGIMELASPEVMAVLYADLVLWLAQTEFEVLAPLITQEDFKWKETYLSMIYIIGGVELVVIFLLIWYVGSKVNIGDTSLLLFSLCLTTCSLLLLIIYGARRSDHSIAIFVVICFLVFFSVPLNLVASKSLLTKITKEETQGFVQGVYSSVSRLALIFGPVIGSSAFHNLALFGSLMTMGNIVAFIWLILSLERIRKKIQMTSL